jgi:hypothetical protein
MGSSSSKQCKADKKKYNPKTQYCSGSGIGNKKDNGSPCGFDDMCKSNNCNGLTRSSSKCHKGGSNILLSLFINN